MNSQSIFSVLRDILVNAASVQAAVLIYLPDKLQMKSKKDTINIAVNTIFSLLLISLSIMIDSYL